MRFRADGAGNGVFQQPDADVTRLHGGLGTLQGGVPPFSHAPAEMLVRIKICCTF